MTTIAQLYATMKAAMGSLARPEAPLAYALCQSFEDLADSASDAAYTISLGRGAVDGQRAWHGQAGREDDFLMVDVTTKHLNKGKPQSEWELNFLADERRRIWQTLRDRVQNAGQHVGVIVYEGGELIQDEQEPSIYFSMFRFRVEYDDAIVSV